MQHVRDLVHTRYILLFNDECNFVQGISRLLDLAYKAHFVMANVNRACNASVNDSVSVVCVCVYHDDTLPSLPDQITRPSGYMHPFIVPLKCFRMCTKSV